MRSLLSMTVGLLVSASISFAAGPSIGIAGLDGAAHWMWFEGEDATLRILAGADSEIMPDCENPKPEPDGTSVVVSSAVVTAVYSGFFYIEAANRTFGVRVNKSNHGLSADSVVDVSGTLGTNEDGERYIDAASITLRNTYRVKPVAMNCRALGGGDFSYVGGSVKSGQIGVDGGVGLNNIGMLVRVGGIFMPTSASRGILNDGSGVDVLVSASSDVTFPTMAAPYPYVTLTGICSCEKDAATGAVKRLLSIKSADDIQWLTPYHSYGVATFEPDTFLPEGDSNAVPTAANLGGYIRMCLYGCNDVKDVLVNDVSLNDAFIARTPDGKSYTLYSTQLGPTNQELLNAGDPVWYRILPVDSVGATQILVRLRHVPSAAVKVSAKKADGSLIEATVTPSSAVIARFGLVTVSKDRTQVYAYVLLPSGSASLSVSNMYLDGVDVTSRSSSLDGFDASGSLPVKVGLDTALAQGSYHIIECTLSDERRLITSFRANNAFAIAMWGWSDKAHLVTEGRNSLSLNGSTGSMDAVGKRWDVKIQDVGTRLNYGVCAKSGASESNGMYVKLLPSSDAGSGLTIETIKNGVTASERAQYTDGPDGDWITSDEIQDGDTLSIACTNRTGNNRTYAAYLNDRGLKWWSGASSNAGLSEFVMPVELDQPGVVSCASPADFVVDSVSLSPDAKSAALFTDFSEGVLDSHLEQSETGTWTVQNGACYHTTKSTHNYGRTYIRTIRSDYANIDWTYEVTFNRYSQSPQDYKYIGLGDGNPSASYYGVPKGVYFAPEASSTGNMNVYRYNGAEGGTAQLVGSCGAFPGWGTERVRIAKTGSSLQLQVDFNYSGGAFVPDGSTVTVDLSDSYYSFLDASNSRLFFGCTEAANDWFDDMSVSSTSSGTPFADDFTTDLLSTCYVAGGDGESVWKVDTESGALSLDCAVAVEEFMSDLKSHNIDAWGGYDGDPLYQKVAEEAGVRFQMSVQDMTPDAASAYADSGADMYSYWLFDEPDVQDHYVGMMH